MLKLDIHDLQVALRESGEGKKWEGDNLPETKHAVYEMIINS